MPSECTLCDGGQFIAWKVSGKLTHYWVSLFRTEPAILLAQWVDPQKRIKAEKGDKILSSLPNWYLLLPTLNPLSSPIWCLPYTPPPPTTSQLPKYLLATARASWQATDTWLLVAETSHSLQDVGLSLWLCILCHSLCHQCAILNIVPSEHKFHQGSNQMRWNP